jgi:hypothetical protein
MFAAEVRNREAIQLRLPGKNARILDTENRLEIMRIGRKGSLRISPGKRYTRECGIGRLGLEGPRRRRQGSQNTGMTGRVKARSREAVIRRDESAGENEC